MQELLLCRPLAFLDLETTGRVPSTDRIVEISVLKLLPDGSQEVRAGRRVNPGLPIPPDATAVHGITDADVADRPPFQRIARSLHDFLFDCDFAGFGIARFDLPLLQAEFHRAGIEFSLDGRAIIDAMTIYHLKEPRDLVAAVRFYCGHDHPNPHASEADAQASLQVLLAQLARYPDLPKEVGALHRFLNPTRDDWLDGEGKLVWRNGEAILNFGKHRNKSLRALASEMPDYLQWVANGNFSAEVKRIVLDALEGNSPSPLTEVR